LPVDHPLPLSIGYSTSHGSPLIRASAFQS
jgi:hypothetical protein